MSQNKQLKIRIAADGTCAVDALNFVGPACQAATAEIVVALGGAVQNEQLKPEARQREPRRQRDREAAR